MTAFVSGIELTCSQMSVTIEAMIKGCNEILKEEKERSDVHIRSLFLLF
tara:strand:- start:256 stop:402 length:147 start_codon:yes stop_codon:yes gene_type:complete